VLSASAHLIQQDQALPATMRQTDTKWRGVAFGGHRRDNNGSQIIVHFGRG
jgi:hypothetical protein